MTQKSLIDAGTPIIIYQNRSSTFAAPALLPFDTQILQRGITYNSGTKRFTVPATGIYLVSAYFLKQTASVDTEVLLGLNTDAPTEANAKALGWFGPTGYGTVSFSQAVSCVENDYLTFYLSGGAILCTAASNWQQVTIVRIA